MKMETTKRWGLMLTNMCYLPYFFFSPSEAAATDYLLGLEDFNAKKRFLNGIAVTKTGWDADDEICCSVCGYSVSRNDEWGILPKHCPDCGTKLIY